MTDLAELNSVRVDVAELGEISAWLRIKSATLKQQVSARRKAADSMKDATAAELKEAAQISQGLSGRVMKPMTVQDAKKSAKFDTSIADRLEAESAQLSIWADKLDGLAAALRARSAP